MLNDTFNTLQPGKTATDPTATDPARYVVILAGGEGSRMRPMLTQLLGQARPKQYCTFAGSRSMLQHAVDHATALAPPENIVTVIGQGHRHFLDKAVPAGLPGQTLELPGDRGTAASLFLAAAHIMETDPEATLLIMPSDFYACPPERFLPYAEQAFRLAERSEQLVLLGAAVDCPETDYGWIEVGDTGGTSFCRGKGAGTIPIRGFHEKPTRAQAINLLIRGQWSLWNTMVLAIKASALWQLGYDLLPDMLRHFDTLRQVQRGIRHANLHPSHMDVALAYAFDRLQPIDIAHDFLPHAVQSSVVLPMLQDVRWTDAGRSHEGIAATVAGFGAESIYPIPQCA